MERVVGTVVRGLRTPIFKEGDDMSKMVYDVLLNAAKVEGFSIDDKDILAITESVVARTQGNYASIEAISKDIVSKLGNETIGVIFPILSRNRFATTLKGISMGVKKVVLMLQYPSDEVGNGLVTIDELDEQGVNPWTDVLTEEEFREKFGYKKHHFTGVDYIDYYKSIIEEFGAECEIVFSNHPKTILNYTKNILTCDIHSRFRTMRILKENGAEKVVSLGDILAESVDGSGYNEEYGLLGSNMATENSLKLFPRDCFNLVADIQELIKKETGKTIEVMIYGDGAFKDPSGKIWELADPVVSPGYTKGLEGTPNEIKIKYIADNNFPHLEGDELKKAISDYINNKQDDLVGEISAQGTTPRNLTDLIGSLCDLTSGSGDKGTPVVYIKGYFDNYTK